MRIKKGSILLGYEDKSQCTTFENYELSEHLRNKARGLSDPASACSVNGHPDSSTACFLIRFHLLLFDGAKH